MDKVRWSRSEAFNGVPAIDLWPSVKVDLISEHYRDLFIRRSKAIRMYIEGYILQEIYIATKISNKNIQSLAKRCIEVAPDGNINGFRCLIPYFRNHEYNRTSPVHYKFKEAKGGLAGIFKKILNTHPELEDDLKGLIKKINSPKFNVHEKKIRARDLHSFFLRKLKDLGYTNQDWPFNTKFLGLRSIEKYMKTVLDTNFSKSVRNSQESDAIAHLAVGSGNQKFLTFEEPYEAVQLDAYSINAFFSTEFDTPEGTTCNGLTNCHTC